MLRSVWHILWYISLKILIVIIFSNIGFRTISHICKNVHSILLYQISYAYLLRLMNYHQKPDCCVKYCHTAATSCQYHKTGAYISKDLLSHIAARHDGVGVNATSCCYCQLSKTLGTHTQNIHNHDDLKGQLTFLKNGKEAKQCYSFKKIYILLWGTDCVA